MITVICHLPIFFERERFILFRLMGKIKDLMMGLGLLVTGLFLSTLLQQYFPALHTFKAEIFTTNCRLLLSNRTTATILPQLPESCTTIEQMLPASLIANGVAIMLFGTTKWMSLVSIINLVALSAFYCNPLIDSSFRSYANFLQVLTCASAFLVTFLKGEDIEKGKSHRD